MSFIAKVLSVERVTNVFGAEVTEVKIDGHAGAGLTVEYVAPPGVDANPVVGDYCVVEVLENSTRRAVVLGFMDPKHMDLSKPGELFIYARDSSGDLVSFVLMAQNGSISLINNGAGNNAMRVKNDGRVEMVNANGSIKLMPDGSVDINGFIIAADGTATDSAGKTSNLHTHTETGTETGGPNG